MVDRYVSEVVSITHAEGHFRAAIVAEGGFLTVGIVVGGVVIEVEGEVQGEAQGEAQEEVPGLVASPPSKDERSHSRVMVIIRLDRHTPFSHLDVTPLACAC